MEAVILRPMKVFILIFCPFLVLARVASADRTSAPILPPGQPGKVTRADFTEKEATEAARTERLAELEEENADSEAEREAKRLEREAIVAAQQAEKQAEDLKKAQAPEDFVADATKSPFTEAPKTASNNETVVQETTVVAAATLVVARRSR